MQAQVDKLQQDVLQQKDHITELSAELAGAGKPQALASDRRNPETQIASLTLDAGLTRGGGETKRLTVPGGAEIVKVTLHMDESPDGVIQEELMTAERQPRWSQRHPLSKPEIERKSTTLIIPASLLTPDDYLIILSRESPNGPERLASYSFRVVR
jgi:hypothetical protein